MDGDYAAARSAPPGELGAGLRAGSTAFLDGALANPGLGIHHLLILLRNPAVTPGLIARIARSPIWMKSERLRAAIVLNARCPRPLAMGLLPSLRWGNLARAAAAPQVASTVRTGGAKILALRLPELAPGEKVSLARTAPAALIPLLLRETHPMVARALLENPRTRWDDVLGMVDRPDAPPAVLRIAADCERFSGHDEILLAIAGHPHTPPVTALRLVRRLDPAALERLLAREGLQPLLQVAATRRLGEIAVSTPRTDV